MIPKKIHYCWFGRGQMPELAVKCIKSWGEYLPNYEIIMWNEDNFDVNQNRYTKEAYDAKKYAFVTDYVRLYALYHHGGIYMDTDVEVIKPLDDFLNHRAFTGCEDNMMCVTGTMASEKGHKWIEELLLGYTDRVFLLSNGSFDNTPNTKVITDATIKNYGWQSQNTYQVLKEDLNIYPYDVFCAKEWRTQKLCITENTHTIHHFSASWHTKGQKLKRKISTLLGHKITYFILSLINKSKGVIK